MSSLAQKKEFANFCLLKMILLQIDSFQIEECSSKMFSIADETFTEIARMRLQKQHENDNI